MTAVMRTLLPQLALVLLIAPRFACAAAQTDPRYELLTNASIDGYPTDDDVTAIDRYLRAAGDGKLTVPSDVATWIMKRIGHMGPSSTPRLIDGYMHFLRDAAIAPPFDAGQPNSTRHTLLQAIEKDLISRRTPLAELAVLMFRAVNDQQFQQLAQSADDSALEKYPWLSGLSWPHDWMIWGLVGLNPDSDPKFWSSPGYGKVQSSPAFPIVTQQAKAGLIPVVQTFIDQLNLRSPVGASSMNFVALVSRFKAWTAPNNYSIADSDRTAMRQQCGALSALLSDRASAILDFSPHDQQPLAEDAALRSHFAFDMSRACDINQAIAGGGAMDYEQLLGITPQDQHPLVDAEKRDRFVNLGIVLTQQQMRVLALGAYAILMYQRATNGPAIDIPEDQILRRLAAIKLPRGRVKTKLVKTLATSDLAAAAGTDLSALAACNPRRFVVAWRHVALSSGTFVETLDATCVNGSTLTFASAGRLTPDFVQLLEIAPDYFDVLGISLGARSIASLSPRRLEEPDDIDLICQSPTLAVGLILAELDVPAAPWSYSRDVLLQYWPSSIAWLTPGWRPAPPFQFEKPRNDAAFLSPGDFTAWKSSALAGEANYLNGEAIWRFYNAVWAKADATPSSITSCDDITWALNLGHCPSTDTVYTGIPGYLKALDALAQQGNQYLKFSSNVNDGACKAPRIPSSSPDTVSIGVNAELTEFVTSYMLGGNGCSFAYDSALKLDSSTRTQLLSVLDEDPLFFNRFQIDLADSSTDWTDRLAGAIASQDPANASRALEFLESQNLLEYIPSDPKPPLRNATARAYGDGAVRNAITDIMIAPLLRTSDGTKLARDLVELQQLAAELPGPSVTPPHVSDAFVAKVEGIASDHLAAVNAKVDSQVASALAALAALTSPPAHGWWIGVSVGVGGTSSGVISFTYNGISLGLPITGSGADVPSLTLPLFNMPSVTSPFGVPTGQQATPPTVGSPDTGSDTGSAVGLTGGGDVTAMAQPATWSTLLNADNETGRRILQQQLDLAKPLLSASELTDITSAMNAPQIPASVAQLIAKDAATASRSVIQGGDSAVEAASSCPTQSWLVCGYWVKRALDVKPANPKEIVGMALLWGKAFDRQYNVLRSSGNLDSATLDQATVTSVLTDKLIGIAIESTVDQLLEGWLEDLPAVLKFGLRCLPVVHKTKGEFDSIPSVASDYDELLMMNDEIQSDIASDLGPFLKPNWQQDLENELTQNITKIAPGRK